MHEDLVIFGTIDSFLHTFELSSLNNENYVPKKLVPVNGGWIRCMKKLNNYLYLACDDKILRVYSLKTYHLLEEFVGHEDNILCLDFADCMVFSGSNDHTIRSWDLNEMENRIWERRMMIREDIISRKFEAYNAVLEKKKKRRKGKKGKKGKKGAGAKKKSAKAKK